MKHLTRSADARNVTVATYNIHRGRGRDRRRDASRIARVMGEIDADVFALQEVDWHAEPALGGISQADYFMGFPSWRAIAGPNLRDHRGHYGNVLLTRMPVLWHRLHDLSVGGREPRGAIEAVLGDERRPLRVIATHLGLSAVERRRQSGRLAEIVRGLAAIPTVLLADINDWRPGTPSIRAVLRLFDRGSQPPSWPARLPLLRLDRILARGFAAAEIRSHVSPLARIASDHLPVRGVLRL